MTPGEVSAALGVVGPVVALGLFLPDLDKAWNADPNDGETLFRVRLGESLYLGAAAAITLLAAYAQGSPAPFVLGFGLAVLVVAVSEYATRRRSSGTETA